uniref:Uncharacterized protein n=1 Tax=Coturnix japonica TaxID=93934 RepID=A0A8C2T253_COTJA
MAAPSEGRPGRGASSFPGTEGGSFAFPFTVPPGVAGSGAEEQPKKPCRACTDFKSWLREQRKQQGPEMLPCCGCLHIFALPAVGVYRHLNWFLPLHRSKTYSEDKYLV